VKCIGTSGPRCSTTQSRHARDLGVVVVVAGISSVVSSSQTVGLVAQILQRLQHRRQAGAALALVEVVGERLQVDVGRVHVREEALARPRLM
jgi:glutamine phosphoribosylpyrophosphate amidotransferase